MARSLSGFSPTGSKNSPHKGHSTLEMVKIYVGLANRDVALLHQKFSPMDRMGIVPGGKRRVVVG